MMGVSREDIDRFQAIITERLGLSCSDWQAERLPMLLRERMQRSKLDAAAYLQWLSGSEIVVAPELGALAEQLTVGETYFFRESKQIDALLAVAVPEITRSTRRTGLAALRAMPPGPSGSSSADGPLRILSAGCSSGEEAYTLAIALRQYLGEVASREVTILGIDTNPAVIRRAQKAQYSAWSLRATPRHIRERWFTSAGQDYRLSDEIRAMVTFEERNLLTEDPSFWRPDAFDIVFCRNVTIYFSPQATRAVIARMERSIIRGGFLFLGHSETLRGISDEFELLNTHETFYYRRKARAPRLAEPAPPSSENLARRPDERHGYFDDDYWVDAIQKSLDRIKSFTRAVLPEGQASARAAGAAPVADSVPPPKPSLATALDLFKAERFDEAMELLSELRREAPLDRDVELFTAVIACNQGRFYEAERVCKRLLQAGEVGDRAAAAYYILGLCDEHAGNRVAAMDSYRAAIKIDPRFAMPHIHLGLLARRAGDTQTARAEMRLAAGLVSCERLDRIVLFGGGFHRNALLELCRAELHAAGESP